MIEEAIQQLLQKRNLSYETAKTVMNEMMNGIASPVQMGAYITALAMKGETIEEITASAAGMREYGAYSTNSHDLLEFASPCMNDQSHYNVFALAARVVEAAGIKVAKPGKIAAMKHVDPICQELGIHTIFDMLELLTNPAGANIQIVDVPEELVEPIAHVLSKLGVKRAMVIHGQDGSGGISVSAPTSVCEVKYGQLRIYTIEPEQFGMELHRKEEWDEVKLTESILKGEKGAGRDAVVINAGAGLYVAGAAVTLEAGIELAKEIIDSGRVKEKIEP